MLCVYLYINKFKSNVNYSVLQSVSHVAVAANNILSGISIRTWGEASNWTLGLTGERYFIT